MTPASTSVPAAGEIRVHEEYGGATVVGSLDRGHRRAGRGRRRRRRRGARRRTGYAPGRPDVVGRTAGCSSELELTEPGLYLDVLPGQRRGRSPIWSPALVHARLRRLHSPGPSAKHEAGTRTMRVTTLDAVTLRSTTGRREGFAGSDGPSVAGNPPRHHHDSTRRNRRSYAEADCFQRGGPSRPRAGHEHPRRRRQGDARPQGPQRRPGEEVGRPHDHQRRCVHRQGDRARGPLREDRRRARQGGRQEDRRRRR